jgi:hypothetical protein
MVQEDFYFHQQPILIPAKENEEVSIKILYSKMISSLVLIRYLHKRNISLSLAEKYCPEIIFRIYNKTYMALGFKIIQVAMNCAKNFLREVTAERILRQSKTVVKKVAYFGGSFAFFP